MDAQFWRNVGILFHVIGIMCLSTGVIGTVLLDLNIWKNLNSNPQASESTAQINRSFSIITQVGSGLMFVSGVILLAATDWLYLGKIWLIIKLVLYVLLALNGAIVGGRAGKQLRALLPQWVEVYNQAGVMAASGGRTQPLTTSKPQLQESLQKVRQRLMIFHIAEITMFLVAVFLGVFKLG